jgi:hypothetical protein
MPETLIGKAKGRTIDLKSYGQHRSIHRGRKGHSIF